MTANADNIRLWASLRSLRKPLSQRMIELSYEDRRKTLAENHIAGFLANSSTVSPPSNIGEDEGDYIGQEWIVDVKEVASEIDAQGFRDEAEFLKQQCQRQFGQPDFSASNELEAVRNLLAFIDSNEVIQTGEDPVNKTVGSATQRPDDRPDGLNRPAFDTARPDANFEPSQQARQQMIVEHPGTPDIADAVQGPDAESEAVASAGPGNHDGGDGMGWREARDEADKIRLSGERFTSYPKMAKRIGCSRSTLHKAIKDYGTVELQEWVSKQRGESRLNAAPEVAAVAIENRPQNREADPAEIVEEADIESILAYLLDQAKPGERARIHEMDPAAKRQLAETALKDPAHEDQALRHYRAKRSRRG